jgi:catechol 2,3-dioxygenase-like lactoylglutathione lyase family enzyme
VRVSTLLSAAACAVVLVATAVAQAPAVAPTVPYDHIHLNAPGPAGSQFYEKNFGGKRITEAPDRLMYGSTRLMFLGRATNQPSAGSAVDHFAFSVPDIAAKMRELEANGVKIVEPVSEIPGLFKHAFVEDPFGTRIEVVQDPEYLGLHHVHLRGPNTEEIFTWLLAKFGGQRQKLKGQVDAIKYSAPGFSDVWILADRGESVPTQGHAIDHIGWRSPGPIHDTIETLRGKGVTVTSEPSPLTLPNGPPINFSYVAGPAGARIEIVERPGLKPGE